MTGFGSTLYAIFAGVIILSLCIFARSKRDLAVLFIIGFGLYVFKSIFLYFNIKYSLFEDKLASGISIDIYNIIEKNGIESLYNGKIKNNFTFHIQSYLNYIPFKLFGATGTIVIITNTLLQSISAYSAYILSPKKLGIHWPIIAFILIAICPAAVNFSFFGLRDIVIYYGMVLFTLGLVNLYYGEAIKGVIVLIIGSVIALTSRPEMLPMAMIAPALLGISKYVYEVNKTFSDKLKIAIKSTSLLIIIIGGLGVTVVAYKFVIANIGITELVNPVEILDTQAQARFSRTQASTATTGGGSNFLPPSLFQAVPWYLRYVVSIFGMLVVPFPWLLTNVGRILAFSDTIFVFACLIYVYKHGRKRKIRLTNTFKISFWVAILIFATVVSNGGNALRMRLALQPFLIIAAATTIANRKSELQIYEYSQPKRNTINQ